MPRANRGEIWLVDLGMVAKVRPCLILSRYPADDELALFVIVPHTTSIRGNRWEFPSNLPFLKPGVFHLQQVQPISVPKLQQKLGVMPPALFDQLRRKMILELELS
jgi:mRNA interferase MazF